MSVIFHGFLWGASGSSRFRAFTDKNTPLLTHLQHENLKQKQKQNK